ncbi:MAG: NACHT domain-containing protein, partial [Bacteroidota bacterium]
ACLNQDHSSISVGLDKKRPDSSAEEMSLLRRHGSSPEAETKELAPGIESAPQSSNLPTTRRAREMGYRDLVNAPEGLRCLTLHDVQVATTNQSEEILETIEGNHTVVLAHSADKHTRTRKTVTDEHQETRRYFDYKLAELPQQVRRGLSAGLPAAQGETKQVVKAPLGYQEALRGYYKKRYSKIETFSGEEQSIDTFYTQLMVLERSKVKAVEDEKMRKARAAQVALQDTKALRDGQQSSEAMGQGMRQPYLEAYASLYDAKHPIALEQLFDHDGKEHRRVIVLGRAGVGKTTLCRKIAYTWAKNDDKGQREQWYPTKFEAVYVLPVRNLKKDRYNGHGLRRQENLQTAIVRECFGGDKFFDDEEFKAYVAYVKKQLKCHPEKILIVLDGLDESSGVHRDIIKQAKRLKKAYHLWLSRPYGVDQAISEDKENLIVL